MLEIEQLEQYRQLASQERWQCSHTTCTSGFWEIMIFCKIYKQCQALNCCQIKCKKKILSLKCFITFTFDVSTFIKNNVNRPKRLTSLLPWAINVSLNSKHCSSNSNVFKWMKNNNPTIMKTIFFLQKI